MSLRDLVTGSDACTADDGAGPSNAMGALVNNLLGGASKQQEQLRELPTVQQPGPYGGQPSFLSPEAAAMAAVAGPSGFVVPGVGPSHMNGHGAHALMHSIAGPSGMAASPADWDAIFHAGPNGKAPFMPAPPMPPGAMPVGPAMPHQVLLPGAPPPAVGNHLREFFSSALRTGMAHPPPALPPALTASLSVADRVRIRDRSTILARHVFAEQGEAFADQQELPAALPHVHDAGWHDLWDQQQQQQQHRQGTAQAQSLAADLAAGGQVAAQHWDTIWGQQQGAPHRPLSTGWADEFASTHRPAPSAPEAWAIEFNQQQQPPGTAWAEEFATATADGTQTTHRAASETDAMASTRALVDVLSRDADPKMRASKFLQFVSKMSKGELMFEDNKVVERPAQANTWANEFKEEAAAQPGDARWADEFARNFAQGLDLGGDAELEAAWRQQVNQQGDAGQTSQQQGQQQHGPEDWIQEFNQEADEDVFKEWERIYGLGKVEESLQGPGMTTHGSLGRKGQYVFSPNNPFIGDEMALVKGKDLFRRGVLSEAALALEAQVTAHPDDAEAWRLLGTVHAENDDDQQAIAAMLRALKANPRDLDVLLALGVSHVNELETGEAVQHLATWFKDHPQYSEIANSFGPPLDSSQALGHVVRMFNDAASKYQDDAELAVALGVLHHLGRQYQDAITAFETALKIRPQDYSLWNKLGATLANNSRSSEAIHAYQKALDLKPNYMRAWTNMGISFANVGEYNKSARFYVRALALNPHASHVWGYLRTSLTCAGSLDLMKHVDEQNLEALMTALPLE